MHLLKHIALAIALFALGSTFALASVSDAQAREIEDGDTTLFGCTWHVNEVIGPDLQPTGECVARKKCRGHVRKTLYGSSNSATSCQVNGMAIEDGDPAGADTFDEAEERQQAYELVGVCF